MWDLDTLIRQNNQAALDWMMRSRKVEQVQEPKPENWALSLLADKMRAGPINIETLMAYFTDIKGIEKFAALIRKFLPDSESEIMSQNRNRRVYRFCRLFSKKYYPIPRRAYDWDIDEFTGNMPVDLMGMSYSAYHELDMRVGYLLLLSLIVYPYEGDERDEYDDAVPFNPLDYPAKKFKPSREDETWLADLVRSLADGGKWIAPMGFTVVKINNSKIQLKEAENTPVVKETIARTLTIAKRLGIEAEVIAGRTAHEKLAAAKVPLLDKLQNLVGSALANRVPRAGWQPDQLHKLTDGTKYEGCGEFADYACGITGCEVLDVAYDGVEYVEGENEPYFRWGDYNVNQLTKQWSKVEAIRAKIDHIVEWLEENAEVHFQELLEFLLSQPQPKKEKLPAEREYYCTLDTITQEEAEETNEEYLEEDRYEQFTARQEATL
jgi:hypothetical protein